MATRSIITMSERVMECPVCLKTMTPPILQCQRWPRGHSICSRCTSQGLQQCPICPSPMTDMRNWALEDFISKVAATVKKIQLKLFCSPAPPPAPPSARLVCPHQSVGCGLTFSVKCVPSLSLSVSGSEMEVRAGSGDIMFFHKTRMSERAMECPVCLETMTPPILQCQRGHSICSRCTSQGLRQCPICRSPMTDMRNWAFEDIISKVNTPAPPPAPPSARLVCPHQGAGCGFTFSAAKARELDEHILECIYRDMLCPRGAQFSDCFWIGKLKSMMDHFKLNHASSCNIISGVDTELDLNLDEDSVKVFLAATGHMHFIITMKIDKTQTRTAYWAVQHIGSKKNAKLFTYEIHITSKQDIRRRAVFVEHCVNDVVEAQDIINEGKCASMPLRMLAHYVTDNKVTFKLVVKKVPPISL